MNKVSSEIASKCSLCLSAQLGQGNRWKGPMIAIQTKVVEGANTVNIEVIPNSGFPSLDLLISYFDSQIVLEPLVVQNVKREPATDTLLRPVLLVVEMLNANVSSVPSNWKPFHKECKWMLS